MAGSRRWDAGRDCPKGNIAARAAVKGGAGRPAGRASARPLTASTARYAGHSAIPPPDDPLLSISFPNSAPMNGSRKEIPDTDLAIGARAERDYAPVRRSAGSQPVPTSRFSAASARGTFFSCEIAAATSGETASRTISKMRAFDTQAR
jgi:hypothetical protein